MKIKKPTQKVISFGVTAETLKIIDKHIAALGYPWTRSAWVKSLVMREIK